MIRESLYFSFGGRRSTEFPIVNVSLGSGLFEESLTTNKSIVETKATGNDTPYFIRTEREPKQFSLRFAFLEPWNDQMIDEIVRWLDVDFYEPLFFEGNINRVFYAMPINTIDQVHNGLKEGYVNLTIRCMDAYSYSQNISTGVIEVTDEKSVEINNYGHKEMKPEIWLTKIGDGDIKIENLSDGGEHLNISSLLDGEQIYIDCENEIVESSLPNIYRYDDFNEVYIELPYGTNLIKINGSCKIKFNFRYVYK